MEVIKCKCVECTTSRVMDVAFKRDLQHLVLALCRILFNNIQEKSLHKNLQTINQKMYHGDISCITDLHPFIKIFKTANYLQFKTVTFEYSTSTITFNFQWDLKDQEVNLNHLIEISKIHFQNFLSFVIKIDRWKRLSLKNLTNSSTLSNVEQILPGFKYLYDFHWICTDSPDDSSSYFYPSVQDRSLEPGVFFLASDFGVFVVIIIKRYNQNLMQDSIQENDYINLVQNYKKYATERHGSKLITVIGATFTEDPNCICPLEFVDEIDFTIARSVQAYFDSTYSSPSTLSIHQAPRHEINTSNAIYGQSWDQQPQKTPTQLLKMPLHPGKSAPIVGADWAYDKTSENEDFEYNYFKNPDYNYNFYYDYYVCRNYL